MVVASIVLPILVHAADVTSESGGAASGDVAARKRPVIIAHRGASGYLPEHTLEAKSMAYAMGADFIEQDIVLSKDEIPMVLHDIHLDTVTDGAVKYPDRARDDGRYYAIDFSLAEIKTLRVNERIDLKTGKAVFPKRYPVGKGEFLVPTLAEEIELVQGLNKSTGRDVGIYVEIKSPAWHREQGRDISQIVLKLLVDYGYRTQADNVYVQCFDARECRRLRMKLKTKLKLVQLIGSNEWKEAETNYDELLTEKGIKQIAEYADGIGPWLPQVISGVDGAGKPIITPLVSLAHASGLIVHPFTLRADALQEGFDHFDTLLRACLFDAHADGCFTDQPDLAVQFLEAEGGNLSQKQARQGAKKRPNILLLVSDDQRPDTIAALGNGVINTPNLDDLVKQGSVFTRACCANPICTPSRGEILTGCSGFRTGVRDFGGKFRDGFAPIAQTLKQGGYRTCYVGKWHNAGRPSDYGYQSANGLFTGGGGKFWKDQVDAHGRPVTGYRGWVFQTDAGELHPDLGVGLTPDISARFADAAIEEITRSGESPFFLHVNFTAPHDPLLVPPGYANAYDPAKMPFPKNFVPRFPYEIESSSRDEGLLPTPRTEADVRADLAVYYAVISHLDEQVGRIMKSLEKSGQRENTIVVFTSDHGLAIGSHGLRGKQNMYEHTMNVPMLLVGPGVPVGKQYSSQMYLRDLYPTLCEFTDVPLLNEVDGQSIVPILQGKKKSNYDYVFGYYHDSQRMIRGDRWKLIHYPAIDIWQLFDLKNDPDERDNLIDEPTHAAVLSDLKQRLVNWQKEVNDPVLAGSSAIAP